MMQGRQSMQKEMMMNTFYRTSSYGAIGGGNIKQKPNQIIGMGGTFYGGFGAKSSMAFNKKKELNKE